jgi:hypothetical protein
MKKTKWHFIGIICLFTILLFPDIGQAENTELRVTVSMANIRSKPTTASEVLTQVPKGTMLNLDLQEGNWYRVILPPDDEGIVRNGYIHNSIVEKVEASKEPEKETPKIIEKVEDVVEKAEEPAAILEYFEPTEVKTESSLSRFLKKFSLKLSGGVGFFLNGAGDLEKLRLETKDYITAMGKPPASENGLNGLDASDGVPSYESEFSWNPLRINTHFQFGLNFDITDNFSVGISSGVFRARNDDIRYSHSSQLLSDEEWGIMAEIDSTAYNEDYKLSATPLFVNFSYSPDPNNSPGRFTPEFSIGAGPVFARIERNFVQERNYLAGWTSPDFGEGWEHEWLKTTINGNWRATTLGVQISGRIGWNVTRWMTASVGGFVLLANSNKWEGSEQGNWEWGLQRHDEELGEIHPDESDSGGWNYGPDDPLSYYYTSANGLSHPMMFIKHTPPENGLPPSINWNTGGAFVTFTFNIGGGGGIAQPPEKIKEQPRVPGEKGGEEAGQEPPIAPPRKRPGTRPRAPEEAPKEECKIKVDFGITIQQPRKGKYKFGKIRKEDGTVIGVPFRNIKPGLFLDNNSLVRGRVNVTVVNPPAGTLTVKFYHGENGEREFDTFETKDLGSLDSAIPKPIPNPKNMTHQNNRATEKFRIKATWKPDDKDIKECSVEDSLRIVWRFVQKGATTSRKPGYLNPEKRKLPKNGDMVSVYKKIQRVKDEEEGSEAPVNYATRTEVVFKAKDDVTCCNSKNKKYAIIQFVRHKWNLGNTGKMSYNKKTGELKVGLNVESDDWNLDGPKSIAEKHERGEDYDPTYAKSGHELFSHDSWGKDGASVTVWDFPGLFEEDHKRFKDKGGFMFWEFKTLLVCVEYPPTQGKCYNEGLVEAITHYYILREYPGNNQKPKVTHFEGTDRIAFEQCEPLSKILSERVLTNAFKKPKRHELPLGKKKEK